MKRIPGLLKLVAEKTLSELFGIGRYLPDENRRLTVKDLWLGDIVYVSPSSVSVDSEGSYFISPDATYCEKDAGTATLRIKKNRLTVSIQESDLEANKKDFKSTQDLNSIPVKVENVCLTKLIQDLADGEVAYTTPGAITPDTSGRIYVLGNYAASSVSRGNENIKIMKRGSLILIRKDTIGSYKFTPSHLDLSVNCLPAALVPFF